MARIIIKGHSLVAEGRPHDKWGNRIFGINDEVSTGRAKCECGQLSEVLTSTRARQRWHTQHKASVAKDA